MDLCPTLVYMLGHVTIHDVSELSVQTRRRVGDILKVLKK